MKCFAWLAGLAILLGAGTRVQAAEVVFVTGGGSYQSATREAWLTPFSQKTHITILEDTGVLLAKVRAMVESGVVSWDLIGMGGAAFMQGVQLGLFQKIPDGIVDRSKLIPNAWNEYGVPSEMFSIVMGYSTNAFPTNAPRTFADFWDVKKFPGQRILPARPTGLLEVALLADGVSPKQVYPTLSTPAGLARALNKIRAIRPYVSLWWSSAAQSVMALASGEAVMALGWNGRFQDAIDARMPIAISWNQSVTQIGYYLLLKGAPDRDAALALLHYISSLEAQSRLSRYLAYGPVRTDAWALLDAKTKARLPPEPVPGSDTLVIDIGWWAAHVADITPKLVAIMQGG
ncbi:ABC transporter substrate-binding protein [Acetobacter sp. TBRC 12305]|uniref:ABC transporter substrate-binding protein n=1 Tax=Acetobacter garciniae TaxID=2817435 RepID=A0A939HHE2_9PROT|nr:ABC transporter substrate-binding protein [Acetobacter garciniae]MBO1324448.1 ABC transporter substrate-binding protein [Acetobacter garciniae]MBX0344137.1 ABC transporter substrate-binding protein [Acetobacter garciniae]